MSIFRNGASQAFTGAVRADISRIDNIFAGLQSGGFGSEIEIGVCVKNVFVF